MSNKLKSEVSPYLLQHADNPVHWYPWCDEAFEKAREEDKPIFLSIGYSTCHWCHVMAHESFEDEETAEILNRSFVCIKVDREERPDIDSVYMSVCQAFTGSGGWPTSIFMSWDKKPFFAGTYFPPHSRYGMPGFCELAEEIARQWRENRPRLIESAEEVMRSLKNKKAAKKTAATKDIALKAAQMFSRIFDSKNGGFGSEPKFPTPHNLLFLMLYSKQYNDAHALEMAEKTLVQMRKGGIYDHVGGGFSRYSTDARFLVPHFEKMLYDNALLIMAYAAAYSVTNREIYLDTARETAEYILREMTSERGGFYSAQDADSEGVEGKFYVFSPEEITAVLGERAGKEFSKTFDISRGGNFEGASIPNQLKNPEIVSGFEDEKKKLKEFRKKRTWLHLDDKILLSWNALMIAALCMLYRVTRDKRYLAAAEKAFRFVEENLRSGEKLYSSWRDEKRSERGFLDDYAFYAASLLELYNSTLDAEYLSRAEEVCLAAVKCFEDDEEAGFFLSASDSSELFMNPKESYDGAMPSGNAVMAYNLVRLYQLTEKTRYSELAEKQLSFLQDEAESYPVGHSAFLLARLLHDAPPAHITIAAGKDDDLSEVKSRLPFLSNIRIEADATDKEQINGKISFYVCKDNTCLPPTNEIPF